jgi:hypothetical protein
VQGPGGAGPVAGGKVQFQGLLVVVGSLLVPALLRFAGSEVVQNTRLPGPVASLAE